MNDHKVVGWYLKGKVDYLTLLHGVALFKIPNMEAGSGVEGFAVKKAARPALAYTYEGAELPRMGAIEAVGLV